MGKIFISSKIINVGLSDNKEVIMWGAIIGDIIGSRFEFCNHKSKEFKLFTTRNCFTDDTVMTLAVAKTLAECGDADDEVLRANTVHNMCEIGRNYPDAGWGLHFGMWLLSENPEPYGSYGNGAAMRISPVGDFARSESEVKRLSRIITGVSHDHPEGFKGAECAAMCVYLARNGATKIEIARRVCEEYYAEINSMSCAELLPSYAFDVSCQGSVPQAIVCFLEGGDFEDVLRNAVSIGGDSDTIAAIAGGIAEAYFGIPDDILRVAKLYLPEELLSVAEFCVSHMSAHRW